MTGLNQARFFIFAHLWQIFTSPPFIFTHIWRQDPQRSFMTINVISHPLPDIDHEAPKKSSLVYDFAC